MIQIDYPGFVLLGYRHAWQDFVPGRPASNYFLNGYLTDFCEPRPMSSERLASLAFGNITPEATHIVRLRGKDGFGEAYLYYRALTPTELMTDAVE